MVCLYVHWSYLFGRIQIDASRSDYTHSRGFCQIFVVSNTSIYIFIIGIVLFGLGLTNIDGGCAVVVVVVLSHLLSKPLVK